jgi:uncharacterized protein YndB with AHSA1/START domain
VEAKRWRTGGGDEQTFVAHYLDIVPARRIIYAFDMTLRGERVSASLATVQLAPAGPHTRMVYTEQMAFLGNAAAMSMRIEGTASGFDSLAKLVAIGPR